MDLVKKLMAYARENPVGFTVYIPSLEPVKRGWVIASKDTQFSFGELGLKKVIDYAMDRNRIVGGWENDGKFYFDASIVEDDIEIAYHLMLLHKQEAIFNLNTFKILVNPTL